MKGAIVRIKFCLRGVVMLVAAAVAALGAGAIQAQGWPARTITLIVPFPPGGFTDNVTRPIARELSRILGQPVVVDNRAGAGGKIGSEAIMRAPRDGYTIGLGVPATLSVLPLSDPKFSTDPQADFTPITLAIETYMTLVSHPSIAARTLKEFMAYAKANPGKLNFGTPGNATSYHFYSVLFNDAAGIEATHITYKGEAPALNDLLAGQIQYMFVAGGAKQHVDSGRVIALATTGPRRWEVLPEVPTMAEGGLTGYEATGWLGYVGPAGLPAEVVERLNRAFREALNAADVKRLLASQGYLVRGSSPNGFAAVIRADIDRFGKAIRSGKVKIEN
jgi:tripartite-type tricarboxylate transporter receptor subunit TctC